MLFYLLACVGAFGAVIIGARVLWLRAVKLWNRRSHPWIQKLRKWWDDPTFEQERAQLHYSYFEAVADSEFPIIESLDSRRRAFVAPDIARYLSTFWNDPKVDEAALRAEINHHFPLPTPRAMTWIEWISWNWYPQSRFSHIVRNERFFYDRSHAWRTQAMTPTKKPVDWNENILDVYRISPDANMTEVSNYEKLQIHLSVMTALKDYYGDYSSFTDQHRWASRKLNTYISLEANVHGDPVGNMMMWYDPLRRCFSYRGQTRHTQHFHNVALIAMGLRYVLMFRCRDFFIDDRWFPHLHKGYRNECRLYKDDSVTIVDQCIPIGQHVCLAEDDTLRIMPHAGDIQSFTNTHEAKLLKALEENPEMLDSCMKDDEPTEPTSKDMLPSGEAADGLQGGALSCTGGGSSEVTTYQRPPTKAEVLYARGKTKDYLKIIPKDLQTYTVGRAYRPLPTEAKMTTEDRIIAFDNYHHTVASDTERRLQDYELNRDVAPDYAASSHTQTKKERRLQASNHVLSNQFERVELQAGQYEEFPVITNQLAIGWRMHDPVFEKNMHRLALTDADTGESKTLQLLRECLQPRQETEPAAPEEENEKEDAAGEQPQDPEQSTTKKLSWFARRYEAQCALDEEKDDFEQYDESLDFRTKLRLRRHYLQ